LLDYLARLAGHSKEPSPNTAEARALQASAFRRIWGALLDRRDWVSYVYVPILVPILTILPYFIVEYYRWASRTNVLIQSLAEDRRDLDTMSGLLKNGPEKLWAGQSTEQVNKRDELDLRGFEILQASFILDLRTWKPEAHAQNVLSYTHLYRRLKVLKQLDNPGNNLFRYPIFLGSRWATFRFPRQELQPKLTRVCDMEFAEHGQKNCQYEVSYDFKKVPPGELRDLVIESQAPGIFLERGENWTGLNFEMLADTSELTFWILMPEGRRYREWRVFRHKKGDRGSVEVVKVVTEYWAGDYTILAFKLLSVKPGYSYEVQWFYR
jgi:hypothetical protein